MSTILDYIKNYSKYTFLEEPFNEVDNVIFSLLSYNNFNDIVPTTKKKKISLQDASKLFLEKYPRKDIKKNILAVRSASILLESIYNTKRYKDLLLYNYCYQVKKDMQFGALSILLPDKSIYVSFEGTDSSIDGWREDFLFACSFPTSSQKKAISYLNEVVGWLPRKIYVGGHSKGGNLALVSSMFCKKRVSFQIKNVFINDAPGLRKKEFESKQYQKIEKKLKTYVPKSSFVGMLLRHNNNYIVVDSKNKGIMQHDALSWMVESNNLKRSNLSNFSKRVEKGIIVWLDKLSDDKRKKFVDSLFGVLEKAKINDLVELKKTKLNSTFKIIRETKSMDKETKKMMMTCLKDFIKEIRE